ncbi:MAG: hypothetical protein WD696_04900 [Bryobacteraceae bacterium]
MFGYVALAIAAGLWGFRNLNPYVPQFSPKGWAAIAAAVAVLTAKFSMSAIRGKDFKPHEQGHDACFMAAGAAVPGAVAAYLKNDAHLGEWGLFAVGAFVSILISASIAQAADESPTTEKGAPGPAKIAWTLANFVLGTVAFLFYVLMIVVKAES